MFSRASCRRCGLSAVLISVFLHNLGHEQTHAPQRTMLLFDHLVGGSEQRLWDS